MSNWKDTVMSKEERRAFLGKLPKLASTIEVNMAMLEAQAEISGEAGYKAKEREFEVAQIALSEVYDNGKQAGIREVVEWIRTHNHCGSAGGASSCIATWEWQAKLKE